jgi:hypothetical protein
MEKQSTVHDIQIKTANRNCDTEKQTLADRIEALEKGVPKQEKQRKGWHYKWVMIFDILFGYIK